MRVAVRHMLATNTLLPGAQAALGQHFGVSRQRVHQIVQEERIAAIPEWLRRSDANP